MAIDFSQVNMMHIGIMGVDKITDSTGAVLWQGESGSWHTVWEGSRTIKASADKSTIGIYTNFASTTNGTGFSPRLRITFSFDDRSSIGHTIKYYNNSRNPQAQKPSSPLVIESVVSDDNMIVLGNYQNSPNEFTIEALLVKSNDTSNNRIRLSLSGDYSGTYTSPNYYVSLTVTKIEQFY